MARTAKNASRQLPINARKDFLRAWKLTEALDIYDGSLECYLNIIARTLETRQRKILELEKNVTEFISSINDEFCY